MKIVELFAGIGSQYKALKNIGINTEVVGISEWDIPCLISYNLVHNKHEECFLNKEEILNELKNYTFSSDGKKPTKIDKLPLEKLRKLYIANKNNKNLGSILDVKGIDVPEHDLMTYSFPCQDLSTQGKSRGLYEGKSSSLLWEVSRLLKELNNINRLPKYLLMENVPSIFADKHKEGFEIWKNILNDLGYKNWDFTLKASYFDIPQNRKRAYMVSILNGKDNDFIIPEEKTLTDKRIKDIIVDNIDNKFYLNGLDKFFPGDINVSPTKTGIRGFDLVGYTKFTSEKKVYHLDSISGTITATGAQSKIKVYLEDGRIRILTPRECWLMMGFTNDDFDKVDGEFIDSILTKQAGNSIVVNVLEAIFTNMFLIKNRLDNSEDYRKIYEKEINEHIIKGISYKERKLRKKL